MVTKYERSWQFDIDRAPSDNSTNALLSKSALWYWKAFLVGDQGGAALALWTVLGSSDGVAGALDATDRWTATFDGSKIIRAAPAVNHSWITVQGPNAVDLYMTLDYSTGSDDTVDIVFSKNAPTGGTVTDRPTATDEWVYTAATLNDGSNDAYNFHGWLSATGDFLFLHSRTGQNKFSLALLAIRLSDVKSTDLYTSPTFFAFDDTNGVLYRTQLNGTASLWKGRNFDGSALIDGRPTHPGTESSGTLVTDSNKIVFEDHSTDATDGFYNDFPMYMYVITANKSLKGRLPDLRWCANALIDGDAEPSSGSIRSFVCGDVWVPADAVPTL